MSNYEPLQMTRSRRAILRELSSAEHHPTADEVYQRVRRTIPRISLATVYRNLDILTRHGMIRTLADADGQRRYDATLEDHCHVRCEVCGRVDDVHVVPLEAVERSITDASGYSISGYSLSFAGVCPRCAGGGRRGAEDAS
jgi:Fur family ferric uptake transcriptional regulator